MEDIVCWKLWRKKYFWNDSSDQKKNILGNFPKIFILNIAGNRSLFFPKSKISLLKKNIWRENWNEVQCFFFTIRFLWNNIVFATIIDTFLFVIFCSFIDLNNVKYLVCLFVCLFSLTFVFLPLGRKILLSSHVF